MSRAAFVAGALVLGLAGCKPPLHLTYDYGRAFVETLKVQADFTRPSVVGESYHLYGQEGVQIRINVEAKTAAEEVGTPTVDK